MTLEFDGVRAEIEAALGRDDPFDALERLAMAFERPEVLREDDQQRVAFEMLAAAGEEIIGAPVSAPARVLSADPRDGDALHQLGYQLIERKQLDIGRAVLQYAVRALPARADLLTELVAAYEMIGDNAAAVAALEAAPARVANTPMCRYLLAFNALLMGDLDRPETLVATLPTDDRVMAPMRERLTAMLGRAAVARTVSGLGRTDARGWNYVLSGGLLLHPADGDAGHYDALVDSYEQIASGVSRLAAVLESWDARPAKVLALPDPASITLAEAVAGALGVSCIPWVGSDGVGLVVAYDLGNVPPEILTELATRTPGQLIFSHVASRATEQPIAADLVTALCRTNRAPWDEDPDEDDLGFSIAGAGPDAAPADALATITTLLADRAPAADEALLGFAAAVRPDERGAGLRDTGTTRERRWVGTPVRLA